ncbi:hypothetical protein SPRG_01976 [Saprolegnia parasitica CBS 223.65]|uniref:Pyrroline-5-carboxylate reductase catalytic N-terminal domain-containing protein n=1 Tax=Saprolegnia parasitica (strain CBS 223.65) TaxID=695850 RepID=A0A067CR40_SAPPC|nr:hypothetical protein SPRG_01976 [Saprolegnia parasitica CBS 223.65]KDO33164.1 hypothetical protein SPRG_01976 [Saprolegnia parasitica CBS 223.65]|eukprot:XP_012195927.1 hypothetical protein SPRG_01976 [Saprolegnia parasitica CBS 223.65]
MSFGSAAYSIDYANAITKLDPQLFQPQRLSLRVQPQMHARGIVIQLIAQQCTVFALLVHKLRLAVLPDATTRIGIIGGGRVGVEISQALLASGWPPTLIAISTRQPEDPRWMARVDAAVARYHDNAKLALESDLVLLAVPPSQLTSVGIQVKHTLGQPASMRILLTVLAGVELDKVMKVCACPCALHTRVHPSIVQDVDLATMDTAALAANHYAHNNSAGLRDLCLRFEQFALRLGVDERVARRVAVDLVLGPSRRAPFDTPLASSALWHQSWDDLLSTTQRLWSGAIDQVDVPYKAESCSVALPETLGHPV